MCVGVVVGRLFVVGGGRVWSEKGADVASVSGWLFGVLGGGGLLGFAVLVVLGAWWVGLHSQNFFFEADMMVLASGLGCLVVIG